MRPAEADGDGGIEGSAAAAWDLGVVEDVIATLPAAKLVLDLQGVILLANDAAEALIEAPGLVGQRLHELCTDPDHVDALLRRWAATTMLRPGRVVLPSGRDLRCDGARVAARPLLLVRLVAQHRALAPFSQQSAEVDAAKLRQLSQRLRDTITELREANRLLGAANSELEQYSAAVSHDLQTPLFSLKGYAELLLDAGMVTPQGRPLAEGIIRSANRLVDTTAALLSVARLEAQAPPAEPVDVHEAVRHAVDLVRPDLDACGGAVDVATALPRVRVNPASLAQVLQNLLTNCVRYRSPERRLRVEVTARRTNGVVEVSVRDNGLGITDGDHEKVFGLFQRGSRVADVAGSGIGLATCRKIVTQWGGAIWSAPADVGAHFLFTAPAGRVDHGATKGSDDGTR